MSPRLVLLLITLITLKLEDSNCATSWAEVQKTPLGLIRASKRVRRGRGMPSDFIWSKSADVVVSGCRRKAAEKSEIIIAVLTWFQTDSCGHTAVCYRSNSQLRTALPKCFPFAALPLVFYRSRILRLKTAFRDQKFDGIWRNY